MGPWAKKFCPLHEWGNAIVCPVSAEGNVSGMGIFTAGMDETKKIMDEDPAVKEGIFIYEIYPCRSFPGSSLP